MFCLFCFLSLLLHSSATLLPSIATLLPRNFTLFNTPNQWYKPFHLEEYDATALCFLDIATSQNFQLCFVNTTPNAYTFSMLSYNPAADYGNRLFYRVVWSANRNRLVGEKAVVRLEADGDLTLREADGISVWSTNTSGKGVAGIYLDGWGNLVLFDRSNETVWQSYDYPTDILLQYQPLKPGMRIISRVSHEDGAEGSYSFSMEVGGLALYDLTVPGKPEPYWIFGCYGKNDSFSVRHTCRDQYYFLVDGGTASFGRLIGSSPKATDQAPELCNLNSSACSNFYIEFDLFDTIPNDNTTFLRIEQDGFLRGYSYVGGTWAKRFDIFQNDACLLPNACGSYGICSAQGASCTCPGSGSKVSHQSTDNFYQLLNESNNTTVPGCSPPRELSCTRSSVGSDGIHQHFLNISGVDYFPNVYSVEQNFTNMEVCLETCLHNCACVAVFYHTDSGSCFPYMNQLSTLRAVDNPSFLTFLKVEDAPNTQKVGDAPNTQKSVQKEIIVGALLACLAIASVIVCGLHVRRARVHKDGIEDNSIFENLPKLPTRYFYNELDRITHGFDKPVGSGGFGKVYEGVLADGTRVAVKKLECQGHRGQGKKEFRREVQTVSGINHFNLVRLCGFCEERSERLLVYDFMANGSLDRWLFKDDDAVAEASTLSWPLRFKIAVGTARGLDYLHRGCHEKIIHLDVKPQNILLDENFNAKVADFGLSRLLNRDQSAVLTTMRGTPGYLAPEWLWRTSITDRADVYSFGLVLLEIVRGRRNYVDSTTTVTSEEAFFPVVGVNKAMEGNLSDVVDPKLGGSVDEMQVRRMINTALLCIQVEPRMRPCMEEVLRMLEGSIEVANLPLSKLSKAFRFPMGLLGDDKEDEDIASCEKLR